MKELASEGPEEAHCQLFSGHGLSDCTVRNEWGLATIKRMEAQGVQVEWRTYPGLGHVICKEQLQDLNQWMEKLARENLKMD
mmetsp:Transcript_21285/g.33315  ORF Transcript_21285/g.33315 Transcript_21285/m.33315 type:complete len:82 (+) Transcript_21285:760-1005(+)|eukprot:CAMPEP_0184304878 /NCGR_PEP_ID=MMETSP1049-20130417/14296_1 /TAXON_ID=77928 /ORGANISM="Proteomonas sulcata, Strain CCMP704" /LENGTH=81 /DNA_ID=CAMNT_0026616805 /DNA_START=573 /DNA_END=818 /DNA_ORIENTATION=+